MAVRSLMSVGFEGGETGVNEYQDMYSAVTWASQALEDADASSTKVRVSGDKGGRYACNILGDDGGGQGNGGTQLLNLAGDYGAFDGNETHVNYHLGHYYDGTAAGGGTPLGTGDGFIVARFSSGLTPYVYYGIIAQWQSAAQDANIKYGIGAFDSGGGLILGAIAAGTNSLAPGSMRTLIVIAELNTGGNDVLKLYVDGTLEATKTETANTRTIPEVMVPANATYTSSKVAAIAECRHDDLNVSQWDGNDADQIDTDPTSTFYCEVYHQPISDIATEDDWTGVPDTADKYLNWGDESRAADCGAAGDHCDPTSTTNHYQWAKFAPIKAGTVLSGRLRWNNDGVTGSGHEGWSDNAGGTPTKIMETQNANAHEQHGSQMTAQPHTAGPPTVWTNNAFDDFEGGVKATDTTINVEDCFKTAWMADGERPTARVCAVTHQRAGVALGSANAMTF